MKSESLRECLRDNVRTVALTEVLESANPGFASGENLRNGVAQLRMNNVLTDGTLNWSEIRRVSADEPTVVKYQLRRGDVLFNSTNSPELVGKTALFCGFKEPVLYSNHFLRLRVDPQTVEPAYLSRWLNFQWKKRVFENLCTRWVNQAAVRKDDLLNLRIDLPNLSEQRGIVARLEQADRLRRMCRYALELSQTLRAGVFLEMFGDPASNPKNWARARLGDVLLSAQDGPHVSPKYAVKGVPFLSTRNIRPGELLWEDLKYITPEDARLHWKKVKPEKGDILYTKGGTTGLAKVVDFDEQVAVWVHVAVLKLRRELAVPVWLENMLNTRFCYQQSQELTFGIVNRDLGLKRMPRIQIYLPPIKYQQDFATVLERDKRLRFIGRESRRQAEHLFQSLLHQAFGREQLNEHD